jgi:hypothetical protein
MGGGGFQMPAPLPTREQDVTEDERVISEIRRRQERMRRGVQNLLVIPTSTATSGDQTGLRIPQ